MSTAPQNLPQISDKTTSSLAARLLKNEDYEGVMQAIQGGQWNGWDELVSTDAIKRLLHCSDKDQDVARFPEIPWPITPNEPWPLTPKVPANFVFLGFLIAQGVLSEEHLEHVFKRAQSAMWSPILEQLVRQHHPLSKNVWTVKVQDAYRNTQRSWLERLVEASRWDTLLQTLDRAPELVSSFTHFVPLESIRHTPTLKTLIQKGMTVSTSELKPERLEEWVKWGYRPNLASQIPVLLWESSKGSLEEKVTLSMAWFYRSCELGHAKEANKWLHLARAGNPSVAVDWTRACGGFTVYNVRHDNRVKTLDMIQRWVSELNDDDRSALMWLSWVNMGGQYKNPPHGLEPYRHLGISNVSSSFAHAHQWMSLNPTGSEAKQGRSLFALSLFQFTLSSKGQTRLASYTSDKELSILSDVFDWTKEARINRPHHATFFSVITDAFNRLSEKSRQKWLDRHGEKGFGFWIERFEKEYSPYSLDRHSGSQILSFLRGLLIQGAKWPQLSADQEKWLQRCEERATELKPEITQAWKAESEKARLQASLMEAQGPSRKMRM